MLNNNAKKWVEALRSGDFLQGKYELHSKDDTFCCLGVGCFLAEKDGVAKRELRVDRYKYDESSAYLPESVKNWLGLEIENGAYGAYGDTSLTKLNDAEGRTFDQIADVIESEPEGLFKEN